MEEELKGKEAYEAKKKEREAKRATVAHVKEGEKKKKSTLRWIFWLIILVAVLFGGYLLVTQAVPEGQDFSRATVIEGQNHVEIGTTIEYGSNPPSSGPHYPVTAETGFYDVHEPVEDGFVVHNLEHGNIWITYKPDIPESVRESLKQFDERVVIITPREKNETDIGLSAWGRVDAFDLPPDGVLDVARIEDFIKRYKNQGPERGVPSTHR